MVPRRALAAVALLGAMVALAPGDVRADVRADDRAAAAEAYDRATAAYDAGRHREAALEFRRADTLAPSPAALESALTAAMKADDPALVMELCATAETRPGDPRLDAVAAEARRRFASRAAATPESSPPPDSTAPPASATAPPADTIAPPAEAAAPAPSASTNVHEPVGSTETWATPPAAPGAVAPRAPGDGESGPGRGWFLVALGATAVLGGAAIGTGVATLAQHDAFVAAPTDDARDDGLVLQHTTNGLIAGAALAGVATIVLAAVIDWPGGDVPAASARRPAQRHGAGGRAVTLLRF